MKVERNVLRLPVFASRFGVSLETALAWPTVPFHGQDFKILNLAGVLTAADLFVFSQLCSLHLVTRSPDRRVELTLSDIARWLGWASIGGEQRRAARACLERLLAAAFSSLVRPKGVSTQRWVEGWHLIERFRMPTRGQRRGFVCLSETVTELLEAGSYVLLDTATMTAMLRHSLAATRLWAYLEADTLFPRKPMLYSLFASPPGMPAKPRRRAAIADMLRLTNRERRQTVLTVRRACEVIAEHDSRYSLSVEHAVEVGMWNLVVTRARGSSRATRVTRTGDRGNVNRAGWTTDEGDLGNTRPARRRPKWSRSARANRAVQETLVPAADVFTKTGLPDELIQAIRTRLVLATHTEEERSGSKPNEDTESVVARDEAILTDVEAPAWKREAARAHLSHMRHRPRVP